MPHPSHEYTGYPIPLTTSCTTWSAFTNLITVRMIYVTSQGRSWEWFHGSGVILLPLSWEDKVSEGDCTFSLDLSILVRSVAIDLQLNTYWQKTNLCCSKLLTLVGYLLLQCDLPSKNWLISLLSVLWENTEVQKIEFLPSENPQFSR